MSKHFVLIKEVDVQKMTAINNYLVTGFPSLTSFAGFADSVKLEIQKIIKKQISNLNFSIIVHDYNFEKNIDRHLRYMKSEKPSGLLNPPSFKVEYKCNAVLSLAMTYELEDDIFEDNYEHLRQFSDEIKESLSCLRIAGGIIKNGDDFVYLFENEASLLNAMIKLKNGYFIKSADDLMQEYTAKFDGDALKAIVYALEIFIDESEDFKYKRRQKEWVSATNVGYQYLTEPLRLKGSREDIDVRYAEPITSLIKYKNSKKIIIKLFSEKSKFENEKVMFKTESDNAEYRIKSI